MGVEVGAFHVVGLEACGLGIDWLAHAVTFSLRARLGLQSKQHETAVPQKPVRFQGEWNTLRVTRSAGDNIWGIL